MFDALILSLVVFPLASALYYWAWYKPELVAMKALARHNAGQVPTLKKAPRKPPTKAETQRAIKLASIERYWRRRLNLAA